MEDKGRYWAWLAAHASSENAHALLKAYGSAVEIHRAAKTHDPKLRALLTPRALIRLTRLDAFTPEGCNALFRTVPDMRLLRCIDKAYPRRLLGCPDAPVALFLRGRADFGALPACAVVGTRAPTEDGLLCAEVLGSALGRSDVLTVSGMARGIDSAAHEGALAAGGPTLAVLGCGLDCVYPPESEDLYRRILENGTLLSEYLPGTRPFAANFLPRNRIIAGLCQAVVVVEAGERSGTLHTVRRAGDYGRAVFAASGPPEREASRGANRLLAEGKASPLGDPETLCRAMGWEYSPPPAKKAPASPALSRDRMAVVRLLRGGPKRFDEIAAECIFSISVLNSLLTSMEMEGIIVQSPGNLFALAK